MSNPLISMILQILTLVLLVYALALKRKTKFRSHGIIMALAVILHLITVFAIMLPSFRGVIQYYVTVTPFEIISIIGLVHGFSGIAAIVLGIGLVGLWHFSKDQNGCFKRKKIMRFTLSTWVFSLVLGIALYAIFYGSTIMS